MSKPSRSPEYKTIQITPRKQKPILNKDDFQLELLNLRVDERVKELINLVNANNPLLSSLSLENCLGGLHDMRDRDKLAKVLQYALFNNTNLNEINLRGNFFNEQSSQIIIQSINFENLISLDFSDNIIGDEAISIITDALIENHHLEDLGLHTCNITYEQAMAIKSALRKNFSLTDLEIGNNPFLETDKGYNLQESTYEIIYHNRNVIFEKGESQLPSSGDNTDSRNSDSIIRSRPDNWQSRRSREERIESRKKQLHTLDSLPETDVTSARASTIDVLNIKGCCVIQ